MEHGLLEGETSAPGAKSSEEDPQLSSPFFRRLPLELRLQIYEYALGRCVIHLGRQSVELGDTERRIGLSHRAYWTYWHCYVYIFGNGGADPPSRCSTICNEKWHMEGKAKDKIAIEVLRACKRM